MHSHIGDMDDDWSTRADEGEACANNPPPPPYNCHALCRGKVSECLNEEITEEKEPDGEDMIWCWTSMGSGNRTC